MDPQQVVEHHSEHELEHGQKLKSEMEIESQGWVLSGTPVQNYVHEFYPLSTFSGDVARERLLNLLRSFIIRRTYTSRLFCSPVVTLPEVKELLIETEFCTAEIKELLSGDLMRTLNKIAKYSKGWDDPSMKIAQMLRGMTENTFPARPNQRIESGEEVVSEPQEDSPEVVQKFYQFMKNFHDGDQWNERLQRTMCPRCGGQPVNPLLTSSLPNCVAFVECNEEITATTSGVPVEDMDLENARSSPARRTKKKGKYRSSRAESDQKEESDWIGVCAAQMPSAKLTKIRELITQWIAENPEVKIVIFTQFMDFVRILGIMCETQDWPHAGMRPHARFASVEKFKKQDDMRISIVSLKAGGTGFDMPIASKCILVDLWWNEAVADQALARIYRIGQENKVAFVKIIVKNTIDVPQYLGHYGRKPPGKPSNSFRLVTNFRRRER
ncbi:putative SNF2 family helicase [Aspergillus affinis]|uniref:putative SNF2 family helicase n=1 Tax=Aspergillus affinis TaxID=1070780 RepID=UPI0022FEA1AE|nr:uncharacterized protein KD926_005074 [Aspergillus affinis]KAI9042744.1 hypothetical protein KD926_005074 [Aspergillus affinis]